MIIFFSICCPTYKSKPIFLFFFKVGIFLVFLLANAAKIKSQQVQGDENSGGAETGHNLQPYLGKINLKKLFCCLVTFVSFISYFRLMVFGILVTLVA
jgi:hypothetical protein